VVPPREQHERRSRPWSWGCEIDDQGSGRRKEMQAKLAGARVPDDGVVGDDGS